MDQSLSMTLDNCSSTNLDLGHELLPQTSSTTPMDIDSPAGAIIPRGSTHPFSGRTLENMAVGISETNDLPRSDDNELISNNNGASQNAQHSSDCTSSLLNTIIQCHFPSRITHRLRYIVQRLLRPATDSVLRSARGSASVSLCAICTQNEANLSFIRWQYEHSVLHTLRLVDLSSEGSVSLTVVPVTNAETYRVTQQESQSSIFRRSLLFYITDTVDRHREMRLDIDSMSYEQLLALEDGIGDVNTGLSEETISTSLKRSKFFLFIEENTELDCCSICQENYLEDDDLGTLNCQHFFHLKCIKQWLGYKNICPVCKSTGLSSPCSTPMQIHSL